MCICTAPNLVGVKVNLNIGFGICNICTTPNLFNPLADSLDSFGICNICTAPNQYSVSGYCEICFGIRVFVQLRTEEFIVPYDLLFSVYAYLYSSEPSKSEAVQITLENCFFCKQSR